MPYFARFEEVDGDLYRFDTRIYLSGGNPSNESICVGAVVGINPGSARPRILTTHHELELGNDKLLPYVRNRFRASYEQLGGEPPSGAFVQVLNLFYLCNKDLGQALARLRELGEMAACPTEKNTFPLAWYAWGAESKELAPLKRRFLNRNDRVSFYMNRDKKTFGEGAPGPMEFAKHPRCMPAVPVEAKLKSVLAVIAADQKA